MRLNSRRAAGFRSEFVGFEKTDVLTQIGALEEVGDGLFLAKLRESPFYAAGGGQVTDAGWIERDDGSGARAELREAYRLENDQALLFEGDGLRRRRSRSSGGALGRPLPDDGQSHRDASLHKALRDVLGDHVTSGGLCGAPGQASRSTSPIRSS